MCYILSRPIPGKYYSDLSKFPGNLLRSDGYAQQDSSALALITLLDINPKPDASCYTDYVLLKGKLLIENLSFEEALYLFEQYLENAPGGEAAQIVYFLSALCYQGLDNRREALRNLEAAYAIDRDSEYGKAAKRMMENL